MSSHLLPVAVSLQTRLHECRQRCRSAWQHRHDEDGVDEAVTKMIWLAAGIVVAIGATAFFMSKFNQAKDSVPDPVGP